MKIFFLLSFLIIIIQALKSPQEYKEQFDQFLIDYSRDYVDDTKEMEMRFQYFIENLDFIDNHNMKPNQNFKVGMNHFGDWSRQEYIDFVSDFKPTRNWINSDGFDREIALSLKESLPKSWDWRNEGAVTPIADQLQCGSSPYFAAVTSVEGCHKMTTDDLVVLSAQNMVDCPGNTQNQGCDGGWMFAAMEVIIEEKGIDTNSCYPYTGEQGNCKFNPHTPCCGSRISSYVNVTSGDSLAFQMAVLQAPVATAVDASESAFEFYTSGVYSDPSCDSQQPDHGIPVIGYGYDPQSKQDYWILKNSWTTKWGIEGYMWLQRSDQDTCGITLEPSYAVDCGNC